MNDPMIPAIDQEARQWGMFAHLAALAGLLIPVVGNVIGPLVVWQAKKDTMPFVDDQGRESLNFQITVVIALAVSFLLLFVGIGFFLLPVVGVVALVFTVIAGIKASEGVSYRYPFTLRLIK
ncbi:DUF4870 domain-containing protein [Lysobacter pythonis]|uniref:DUF4870 domain-containing protein n=1 Tax=Solilutibacter pythonis TaxID=2483112 RepID=A0A3M2HSC4_9GAMM|nr:DUF4870 domain-containing protein [Lysobacter pythonis]RMH91155.1 DUF4870 domain-containing protein [Lysobacter pythonis]